ncbi:WGR domain-containing protein [Luteimonas huabeiensis]|uniref:WGR domain-containing protein n=1 Tax=Luteimonas huabeiensis TaxID=1244513 RepID=UPI00046502A5|nr:WGR domain-containing protein [Luteimonas huabeiensis]
MRLLLQQPVQGDAPPRFVQLMLQPDLLGGWTLVRESGQIGGRSQLRTQQYADEPSALNAIERARDMQLRRGFQLVRTQAADTPPSP